MSHFSVLGCCRLVMQTQSWQYIQTAPNKLYLGFDFSFSEPYLAGSLGNWSASIPSCIPSLSAGASAGDDMFSDSASSVTALEWNPQPWSLAASTTSIIPFLTNSSHPSLNLIGLWSPPPPPPCKTETANLGSARLNISCFSKFFELRFSHSLGKRERERKKKTWQSQFRCSDVAPSFLA